MTRRKILTASAVLGLTAAVGAGTLVRLRGVADGRAFAKEPSLDALLLHDDASPVEGTPQAGSKNGAVAVVEFFDYRCPYCRIMVPRLRALLERNPSVRLILKDWPIFGGVSIYAAEVALASRWQDKYLAVHDALFALPRTMDHDAVRRAAQGAGVDLDRLDHDMDARGQEIQAALGRTTIAANMLGLQGTPAFVIGHTVAAGALTAADLDRLVAKAKTET